VTFTELRQAIDATLVLCAVILLIQAVPETMYWLVFGVWFGVDSIKLLPDSVVHTLTATPLLGLNEVLSFVLDIWIAGLIALLFATAMVVAALTRRFDRADMMQDLMNPPTRREDIVQVHRRFDQISEEFDSGFREMREKILAVEDRLLDSSASRAEAQVQKAKEGQA
jgi:hypothetical protein